MVAAAVRTEGDSPSGQDPEASTGAAPPRQLLAEAAVPEEIQAALNRALAHERDFDFAAAASDLAAVLDELGRVPPERDSIGLQRTLSQTLIHSHRIQTLLGNTASASTYWTAAFTLTQRMLQSGRRLDFFDAAVTIVDSARQRGDFGFAAHMGEFFRAQCPDADPREIPSLLRLRNSIASAYLGLGANQEALAELFRTRFAIERSALNAGATAMDARCTHVLHGLYYLAANDPSAALTRFRELGTEIVDHVAFSTDPFERAQQQQTEVQFMRGYAAALSAFGKYTEALLIIDHAIYKAQEGYQSPTTVAALMLIASDTALLSSNYDKALHLAEEAEQVLTRSSTFQPCDAALSAQATIWGYLARALTPGEGAVIEATDIRFRRSDQAVILPQHVERELSAALSHTDPVSQRIQLSGMYLARAHELYSRAEERGFLRFGDAAYPLVPTFVAHIEFLTMLHAGAQLQVLWGALDRYPTLKAAVSTALAASRRRN